MDFSGITLDTASVLAMGMIVITAYASIWAVNKVIALVKYR